MPALQGQLPGKRPATGSQWRGAFVAPSSHLPARKGARQLFCRHSDCGRADDARYRSGPRIPQIEAHYRRQRRAELGRSRSGQTSADGVDLAPVLLLAGRLQTQDVAIESGCPAHVIDRSSYRCHAAGDVELTPDQARAVSAALLKIADTAEQTSADPRDAPPAESASVVITTT
jgi:hypothetical protein